MVIALGRIPDAAFAAPLDTTFDPGNFVPDAAITNSYWPLIPGTQFVFTSTSSVGCEVELFAVTANVKDDFKGEYSTIKTWEIHGGGSVLITELKGKTLRSEYVGSTLPPGDYAQTGVCP